MDTPANPPTSSDRSARLAQALARTALGDRAAFAELYRLASPQMLGVVLRINRDRAQAEDVLQECFVNIWRSAQSFDALRSQPMTWMTSIARNRAIDSLRRRSTEVSTLSTHHVTDDGQEQDLLDRQASPDAGPLDLLEQASEAQDLTHCFDRLSAEQKQCVALAYYQGLSHSEVALQLAQPLGTVKSWVRRALMALKDCLSRSAMQGGV